MPPHIEPGMVLGTMLYGAKAVPSGRAHLEAVNPGHSTTALPLPQSIQQGLMECRRVLNHWCVA
jgi:hypothetical protein